ncbi:MAG: hypothetical protein K8U57_19015 [Planctomycetes bacterium]|nr:hypothetical protein [Planctomycetota bacterium]
MPATYDANSPTTTSAPKTVEITAGTGEPQAAEWHLVTVSSLSAAQEMLDSLEAQGFAEREFVVLGNSSFAVRWR